MNFTILLTLAQKFLPWIKTNYKLVAFVLLVILVIILWLRGEKAIHRAEEAEIGRDVAIKISNGLTALSHKYKNKQGDTVTVTPVIGVPQSQVEALLKAKDLQWLKKFEGLKKDGSNLQSATSFETEFEGVMVPEKIKYLPCKDSVKAFAFDLHDGWNDIYALVVDTPKFEIRDKYYAIIEMKRTKRWFWRGLIHGFTWGHEWEPISELTNSNKLIKIDSVSVLVVNHFQ